MPTVLNMSRYRKATGSAEVRISRMRAGDELAGALEGDEPHQPDAGEVRRMHPGWTATAQRGRSRTISAGTRDDQDLDRRGAFLETPDPFSDRLADVKDPAAHIRAAVRHLCLRTQAVLQVADVDHGPERQRAMS